MYEITVGGNTFLLDPEALALELDNLEVGLPITVTKVA
jgi:hypothetical protein